MACGGGGSEGGWWVFSVAVSAVKEGFFFVLFAFVVEVKVSVCSYQVLMCFGAVKAARFGSLQLLPLH